MRILKFILILLVFTNCGKNQNSQEFSTTDFKDLTDRYNLVWETLDMDSVAKYHTQDFKYWDGGKLLASSNREFKEVFKLILNETAEWNMEVGPYEIQETTDATIVSFVVTDSHLKLKDGSDFDYGRGAFTYVWVYKEEAWKLAHVHESHLIDEEE